jgi:uncharacterized protein (DUF1778 family)
MSGKTPYKARRNERVSTMRTSRVELRVTPAEKEAFEEASSISGEALSAWMRLRLRQAAVKELEDAERPIPFLSMKRKS